jgi:hypothetical protein
MLTRNNNFQQKLSTSKTLAILSKKGIITTKNLDSIDDNNEPTPGNLPAKLVALIL